MINGSKNRKINITLPGFSGVNSGPIVDILTGVYVADVVLVGGKLVRVPRIQLEIVQ